MFCMIKGIPSALIDNEINRRLKEVDLMHVKKAPIATFSGGMKRRTSLAISAIGYYKFNIKYI